MKNLSCVMLGLGIAALAAQPSWAQNASGWQFTAAPYVWAPSVSVESRIDGM